MQQPLDPIKIEKIPSRVESTPDIKVEKNWEIKPEKSLEKSEAPKSNELASITSASNASPLVIEEEKARIKEIENVLAEGLEQAYMSLPPDKKREFKRAGEETAKKINILISQVKINFRKIISLIRDWLKIIPGVNRFFLEQEAKIKADKIIRIKDELE